MEKLKTTFAGLELKNPFIVSSSGLTDSVEKNKQLEQAGAAAVVLKSLFEEQIMWQSAHHSSASDYPEAEDYLQGYLRAVELKVQEFYDERTVKLIELYKSKHYQDLSALKLREQKFDGRALNAGLRDGNDVNLLRPVSGQSSSSQLSYF